MTSINRWHILLSLSRVNDSVSSTSHLCLLLRATNIRAKLRASTRSPAAGHKELFFVQCARFQVRKFQSDNKIIGGEITRWINPYLTSRKRTCKNKLVEIRIKVTLESVTKIKSISFFTLRNMRRSSF